MARRPRIHYHGALYHVMVRGNNGENVFLNDRDKTKYLDILAQYKYELGFYLYSYCIMNNHAHLLIAVRDTPLAKIMQRIQQVYTQWFNYQHERTGHVFQQRYKALLCNKEDYLLQLIRYIHNNPVKAHLPGGLDYKWSSHLNYLGKGSFDLVDTSFILQLFSNDLKNALQQYLLFMNQKPDEQLVESMYELKPKILKQKRKSDDSGRKIELDDLIRQVCRLEQIEYEQLISRTKQQRISDVRKAIVLLSEKQCDVKNVLLAKKLNLSQSMISKIKNSKADEIPAYVKEVMQKWLKLSNK